MILYKNLKSKKAFDHSKALLTISSYQVHYLLYLGYSVQRSL